MYKFDSPLMMLSFRYGLFLAEYRGGRADLEYFLSFIGERQEIFTLEDAFSLYDTGAPWIESTHIIFSANSELVLIELGWVQETENLPKCDAIDRDKFYEILKTLSGLPPSQQSLFEDITAYINGVVPDKLQQIRDKRLKDIKSFFEDLRNL